MFTIDNQMYLDMDFYVDQQTLDDLNIFGKYKDDDSVFHLFSKTRSYLGKKKMEQLFLHPLINLNEINDRSRFIYCLGNIDEISLEYEDLDFIEYYLSLQPLPTRISYYDAIRRHLLNCFFNDNPYYIIRRGIVLLIENLYKLSKFVEQLSQQKDNPIITKYQQEIENTFKNEYLQGVLVFKKRKKLSLFDYTKLDFVFRYIARDKVRRLMDIIYELDAFTTAAMVAKKKCWVYATAISEPREIKIDGLYHPLLMSPVSNDIEIEANKNIVFITGANMAGKSTFMKAFGIAVYLAHMGFPVPASFMKFVPQQGIVSTINISDNLRLGYSHFYSEVKRIKQVVLQLNIRPNLMMLFDELFRGTNVKDAYDATVSVLGALARSRKCFVIVSTHIIEAAQEIEKICNNVQFLCFHTQLNGDEMSYSYRLNRGISNDRLGMVVIRREQILEIIENKI